MGAKAESMLCKSMTTEPSPKFLFFLFNEGKFEGNCDIFHGKQESELSQEAKALNFPLTT